MQGTIKTIPIEWLKPGQFQPRIVFAKLELQELADSIKTTGVLQPILVRQGHLQNQFEIIAGERRWRAAQLAGLNEVSCIICNYNNKQVAEAAIIENINRVDLNPIEEARAYQNLITEFAMEHQTIADVVGKSRQKISNLLRLLKLDERIQMMILHGDLTEGHAKVLLAAPLQYQLSLAMQSFKKQWSVRRLETEIKKITGSSAVVNPESVDTIWLEQRISEFFGTAVKIHWQQGKGNLDIAFYSVEGLEGILEKIGFVKESHS